MPRARRIDAPGLVHHVWARALDGRDLFADVDDRRDFLARLERILPDEGARCFGWTLMSNHVHAVVRTGERPLGKLMQRVFTGYAMRFNGRAGRRGYLFQGRYGSRPARDDADLHAIVRYVLRNPLEAGLVRSASGLERFPWGGLGALLGLREALAFESVREALALFGSDKATARARLRALVHAADREPDVASLETIVRAVCRQLTVPESDVRGGRRTELASRARAAICRRAIDAGFGVVEVARALSLSHAAVSQAAVRRPKPPSTSDGKGPSPS